MQVDKERLQPRRSGTGQNKPLRTGTVFVLPSWPPLRPEESKLRHWPSFWQHQAEEENKTGQYISGLPRQMAENTVIKSSVHHNPNTLENIPDTPSRQAALLRTAPGVGQDFCSSVSERERNFSPGFSGPQLAAINFSPLDILILVFLQQTFKTTVAANGC